MSPRVKLQGVWGPSFCGKQVKMGTNGVLHFEIDKVGKRSYFKGNGYDVELIRTVFLSIDGLHIVFHSSWRRESDAVHSVDPWPQSLYTSGMLHVWSTSFIVFY